jgi:hypothetical protein
MMMTVAQQVIASQFAVVRSQPRASRRQRISQARVTAAARACCSTTYRRSQTYVTR